MLMMRPDAAHVDAGEVLVLVEQLDDLTGDPEAHGRLLYRSAPAARGTRWTRGSARRRPRSRGRRRRTSAQASGSSSPSVTAPHDAQRDRHREQHQLGRGVLGDRALAATANDWSKASGWTWCSRPTRTRTRATGRSPARCSMASTIEAAQPELVHVSPPSRPTIATRTVTSGSHLQHQDPRRLHAEVADVERRLAAPGSRRRRPSPPASSRPRSARVTPRKVRSPSTR